MKDKTTKGLESVGEEELKVIKRWNNNKTNDKGGTFETASSYAFIRLLR